MLKSVRANLIRFKMPGNINSMMWQIIKKNSPKQSLNIKEFRPKRGIYLGCFHGNGLNPRIDNQHLTLILTVKATAY